MVFTMIATTTLTHRGQIVKPGARIEATRVEAAVYAYRRQATFAPKTTLPKTAAKPGHVQRRDVTPTPDLPPPPAELPPDVVEPEPVEPQPVPPVPPEGDAPPPAPNGARRARHSQRRDLTPEPDASE